MNTTISHGGAAGVALQLHKSLCETPDITSHFAYGRGEDLNSDNAFKFGNSLETYLQEFITRITGLQGYGNVISTWKLLQVIESGNYNLVHLHNIHGYYLNLNFVDKLNKTGIPVVWTFHDAWPITGSCGYFLGCDRWKNGCGKCPDKFRYPKTYVDASSYMWEKKKQIFKKGWNPVIVSPSKWLANKVKKSYLGKYEVMVIPNAIDTELFEPRNKKEAREELGIPVNKNVVLFVAADLGVKRKGAEYFFDALQYVEGEDLMVVTVGEKVNIESKLGGDIPVKQMGYLSDRTEMAKAYNIADLFSITALQDNFPTTVNESLASGTPVIGFSTGGIPEQITEDCGILVKPKETRKLAEGITELLHNDNKTKKFSNNCRKRAKDKFSIPKFRDKYLDLYKKLLN